MIDWQSGSMWSGLYPVLHLKQVDSSSWLPQHNKTTTHLMHLRVAEQHLMPWWHGGECRCGRSNCNILHCKLMKAKRTADCSNCVCPPTPWHAWEHWDHVLYLSLSPGSENLIIIQSGLSSQRWAMAVSTILRSFWHCVLELLPTSLLSFWEFSAFCWSSEAYVWPSSDRGGIICPLLTTLDGANLTKISIM